MDDKPFTQVVHTIDISQAGTRLGGFRVSVKVGDVVTLLYKHWRGNFQIKWLGQKGTAAEGEAGLQAVAPGDCFWTEIANEIMGQYVDDYYRPPEPTAPAKAGGASGSKPAQPATAADALSTRVRSLTAKLVEIEQDLRSSQVDSTALQEFHEVLDKLRSTCLAVQELIRTKASGGEPRSVTMMLNAERLNAGIDLCLDLSRFARGLTEEFELPLVQKFLAVSEDLLLEAVFPEGEEAAGDKEKPANPKPPPAAD